MYAHPDLLNEANPSHRIAWVADHLAHAPLEHFDHGPLREAVEAVHRPALVAAYFDRHVATASSTDDIVQRAERFFRVMSKFVVSSDPTAALLPDAHTFYGLAQHAALGGNDLLQRLTEALRRTAPTPVPRPAVRKPTP